MNEPNIDDMIRAELDHIGPAEIGRDQATLRHEYVHFRREDLMNDPATPARLAFSRAMASVRRYAPDFRPEYDASFFT